MKKCLFIAVIIMIIFSSYHVFAQEDGNRDELGRVIRGPYETNKFFDNWFIDAGAGAGMYLGGHNDNFGSRITPAFLLGVGKWITPSVGVRASFFYQYSAKEFIDGDKYQFNYWDLHADFLWNLSNALGGYKETRVYQCVPFFGGGYGEIVGVKKFDGVSPGYSLSAGIINKFHVSNRVDLNLEFQISGFDHGAEENCSGRTIVYVPIATFTSITIKLGKTSFQRVKDNSGEIAAAVEAALKAKNAELENANANNQKLNSELSEMKAKQKEVVSVPVVSQKISYGEIPADGIIFFEKGMSDLNKKEKAHLETFAYYVQQCIAAGKNVTLIGSANKDASSAELNMKLSNDRVYYIKDQLVNKYKVDASKIKIKADGDMNNIFGDPELDRCVYVKF